MHVASSACLPVLGNGRNRVYRSHIADAHCYSNRGQGRSVHKCLAKLELCFWTNLCQRAGEFKGAGCRFWDLREVLPEIKDKLHVPCRCPWTKESTGLQAQFSGSRMAQLVHWPTALSCMRTRITLSLRFSQTAFTSSLKTPTEREVSPCGGHTAENTRRYPVNTHLSQDAIHSTDIIASHIQLLYHWCGRWHKECIFEVMTVG